jgi:molybdopterin converting factor small subunit
MQVSVRLAGDLWRHVPEGRGDFACEVEPGTTMRQLMGMLKLPHPDRLLLAVNHKQAQMDTMLEQGDEVLILPFHAGG